MVVSTKEMTVGRRRKAAWVGADLSYLSLCTLSFSMPVECGFKSTNVVASLISKAENHQDEKKSPM